MSATRNAEGKEEQAGKARRLRAVVGVRDRVLHQVEAVRLEDPEKKWHGDLEHAQIIIEKGRVAEGNFDTYQMLRINGMPEVETYLALSGGDKWGGVGEPSVPTIAPAVCNAIFKITGKRIRSLPLKNHDLRKA